MTDFWSMPSAEIVGVIVYDSAGPSRDDIVARIEWIAQHGMAIPELLRPRRRGIAGPTRRRRRCRSTTDRAADAPRTGVSRSQYAQDRPAHPHLEDERADRRRHGLQLHGHAASSR